MTEADAFLQAFLILYGQVHEQLREEVSALDQGSLTRTLGPVQVLPEKTRIALHVRMSFAAFTPRRHWLDGHLVLPRHASHPVFRKIEVYSVRTVVHTLRLSHPDEVDGALFALLSEAYRVGEQRHLNG